MDRGPIPEIVNGVPNLCGADAQVEEITRQRGPVYLPETNLRLDRLQAVFAIALHMQQPLIPAGGNDLRTADLISNLDAMMRNPGSGDNHNATVFADCYGRMGDIIPELIREGKNPRVMLDYSGELLYGLRKMGRGDVLEQDARNHLRPRPAAPRRMARHDVGPRRRLFHALAGPEIAHAGLAARLRRRLRLGRPGAGARLLAAGNAPAQPPRRRF